MLVFWYSKRSHYDVLGTVVVVNFGATLIVIIVWFIRLKLMTAFREINEQKSQSLSMIFSFYTVLDRVFFSLSLSPHRSFLLLLLQTRLHPSTLLLILLSFSFLVCLSIFSAKKRWMLDVNHSATENIS